MWKRNKKKAIGIGIVFMSLALYLTMKPSHIESAQVTFSSFGKNAESQPPSKLSMFSWSEYDMTGNKPQFLQDVTDYGFDRVFQSFEGELTTEDITTFVTDMKSRNVDVYGLSGSPEWAFDPTGAEMISKLNRLVEINRELPEDQRIKGLVIDVEPYVLDDFDWEDQSLKNSYFSGMKRLYEAAVREDLELIVVVPYFYDTEGYKDVVRKIIRKASSEVAIMNYYRDHEIEHIKYEAKIAKNANKPLTTIYEFKRPGEHGLIDQNTYHNVGRAAAAQNAKQLKRHYKNQEIHIAYHDYHAFQDVVDNE